MLDTILKDACPLRESIVKPDPWGWGFELEIFRMDATGYEEAEEKVSPIKQFVRDARKKASVAQARAQGSRRGKGGRVLGEESPADVMDDLDMPVITLDDRLEIIAEHLCRVREVPNEALVLWSRVAEPVETSEALSAAEADEAGQRLLFTRAPLAEDGQPLAMPAGFRGKDRDRVWHVSDLKDGDEEVPYGGYGRAPGFKPTLNRMLALFILEESQNLEQFEAVEVVEAIETTRPITSGSASSPSEESSSDERSSPE